MRKPYKYAFIYVFPALWVFGAYLGSWGHYLALLVGYVGVPLADLLLGPKPRKISHVEGRVLKSNPWYRRLLHLYVPLVFGLIIWAGFFLDSHRLTAFEWVGFILSSALMTGGIGMTVAHELCHRVSPFDILCSELILIQVCYMHFVIEHVYGHHVKVATDGDPATARLGQSLYRFLPQSIVGGYRSAWSLELGRLQRQGDSIFSLGNRMIWYSIIPVLWIAALAIGFGGLFVCFFLAQAVAGFLYLEVINYVEHYGLRRKKLSTGRFEKVAPHHSWNSDHPVSNYLLFGLPTHSDHHASSTKPYQTLSSFPEAPQLPAAYPFMMALAFFPRWWRRIMDPLVLKVTV